MAAGVLWTLRGSFPDGDPMNRFAAAALAALDALCAHADEPAIAFLVERTEALKAARDTLNAILDARDAA